MIHYELINPSDTEINESAIKAGLANAAEQLSDTEDKFVSIEVVSEAESQQANKALRGKDEPTDVISVSTQDTKAGEQEITEHTDGSLSFAIDRQASSENQWPVLGQLIICPGIIAKNAESARQPVERELEWVVEHGVLHLMGYHHDHD